MVSCVSVLTCGFGDVAEGLTVYADAIYAGTGPCETLEYKLD